MGGAQSGDGLYSSIFLLRDGALELADCDAVRPNPRAVDHDGAAFQAKICT